MNGNGFKRGVGSGAVTFRDRVDTMTRWFREWSPCEQTIAAYSLIVQLSPSHVRFLSTVMDAHMQEHSDEVKQLEGEANDRGESSHTTRPPHALSLFHTPSSHSLLHKCSIYQLTVRFERGTSVGEYSRAPSTSATGQRGCCERVHEPSP